MAWAAAAAAIPVLVQAYQQSQDGQPPGEPAAGGGATAPVLAGDETTTTDVRIASSFTVAGSGGPATSTNLTPETPPISLLEQLQGLLPEQTAGVPGAGASLASSPWLWLALAGAAAVGLFLVLRK